jgi:pilus assembly protein CpaE
LDQVENLKAILVGPNEATRKVVLGELSRQQAAIVGELSSYSAVSQLKPGEDEWDVALLDLDTDPELCLAVVQKISSRNPARTVMVYSTSGDSDLLVRSMWAGAREFLTLPLTPRALTEALLRAATRRLDNAGGRNVGKLLVFLGAKGGTGVSTIAANFALALRGETSAETALLDLDLEIGESSLLLGIQPRFTLTDAMRNANRLDRELLSGMLARHESGLALMAGPEVYEGAAAFQNGDLTKLLYLMRDQFAYVVVDAGPNLGKSAELLFELAEFIYVVIQADVPGLRNAQRYVSHLQRYGAGKVRLVLNRYDSRRREIDEEHIAKAVGVNVDWKIPNDYAAVRKSQDTGVPLAMADSLVSRALRQMARAACGKASDTSSKKMFRLFN